MWIRSIELVGFGRLRGSYTFQKSACNILCHENEFGKTTVVDAILYTLFGMPDTGFGRSELKPRDRYRPWGGGGSSEYRTVLEVELDSGTGYRILADFSQQKNWFKVLDASTGKPVGGVAESFGRHFLRMSDKAFLSCFLLKQDSRSDAKDRDELVQTIEHFVSSSANQQGASVSAAIARLSDVKLTYPSLAESPVKLETLLTRMEDRLRDLASQMRQIEVTEEERNRLEHELEEFQQELRKLEHQERKLQAALLIRETRELEEQLKAAELRELDYRSQVNECRTLEAFKAFAPEQVPRLHELAAKIRQLESELKQQKTYRATRYDEPIQTLERELADFPSALENLEPEAPRQLERDAAFLRSREEEAEARRRELREVEARLSAAGLPLDELRALQERMDQISPDDIQVLVNYRRRRLELDTNIAQQAREEAEATTRVTAIRGRISAQRNLVGAIILGTVVSAGLAIAAFLLKKYALVGTAFGVLALVLTGAALVLSARLRRLSGSELELALHEESTKRSEVRRLEEKRAELDNAFRRVLSASGLTEENVAEFERLAHIIGEVRDYLRLRQRLEDLESSLQELYARTSETVRLVEPTLGTERLDAAVAERCARKLERYFEVRQQLKTLRSEQAELSQKIAVQQAELEASLTEINAILNDAHTEGLDLDERVRNYVRNSEKAAKWRKLFEELKEAKLLSEDEKAEKRATLEEKRRRLDILFSQDALLERESLGAATRPTPDLMNELASVQQRLAEKREEYGRRLQLVDSKLEQWRTRYPALKDEYDRLQDDKLQFDQMREALAIAAAKLEAISKQLAENWSQALNERFSALLRSFAPNYSRASIQKGWEVAVYSEDADKWLENKLLGHLSRGARDQVELALRVAASEYLSEHVGRVPIVLDEPFAHWDDERFVLGMVALSQLAASHQVILLTCHRQRMEWLQEKHPALASRLHFCEFSPSG
ncbi:MAG: hypothetical protein KatS3mg130_1987 [Candidatus Sumerlaea sp.]|nr:MAG: hypothetical protein KatS3mg130_1987 [Candidatus Sumerlaea sp.]